MTNLQEIRRSPQASGDLFRQMLPETRFSDIVQALVRSIQIAHRASPSKWGLRLNRDNIMLKVGFVEVLQAGKGFNDDWFHQLVEGDLVPKRLRAQRGLRFSRAPYINAPNCDACDMSMSAVARTYTALLPAHETAIRIAARSPRRLDTTKDHSPGLVTFLGQQVQKRLSQPSYFDRRQETMPPLFAEEISSDEEFEEGAAIQVQVNRYERDPVARDRCIKYYGTKCAVCGFALADRYGPQVTGIIQVHHLRPLGTLRKRTPINPRRDLRPVCPNCHAVIHSISPPRTIEQVKKMIADQTILRRTRDRGRTRA